MPSRQVWIPGGIQPGKRIHVHGRLYSSGKVFTIDLKCDDTPKGHIALHLSARTDEHVVVRNTWRGKWEAEERNQPYFPFSPGHDFSVIIQVLSDRYDVSVNDKPYITFRHRLQYDWVKFLNLEGDASIYHVSFDDQGHSFTAPPPYNPKISTREQVRIHGGLYPGKQLILRGKVDHGAQSMAICLKCDDTENAQIALYFNPRFHQRRVVLNTWRGKWEHEESGPSFPFYPGSDFDITINVTSDRYKISVNRSHYTDFVHRLQYNWVQAVALEGDCHFDYVSV